MTEFEPKLGGDALKLLNCISSTLTTQAMPGGGLSPLGVKVVRALVECLEAKLGARRGPVAAK